MWLLITAILYVLIVFFNTRSLELIRHIENIRLSPYAKAQLLYQRADSGFAKVMNEVEDLNKGKNQQSLIDQNDPVLTDTLNLYFQAFVIDPSPLYSPEKKTAYERVAQLYEACGLGFKRFEYMAKSLLCDSNYKLAEVYAGTAAGANSKEYEPWELLIEVYLGLNSLNYSEIALAQAQKTGCPAWKIDRYNGRIAMAKQDWTSAKEFFMSSLRQNPSETATRLLMAETLTQLQEVAASVSMLEDGIGFGVEKSAVALNVLADQSATVQDYAKACKYYAQCIALEPNNAALRIRYAESLAQAGEPQYKVNEQMQAAITIDPAQKYKAIQFKQ